MSIPVEKLQIASLFAVNGIVAVVTGGGSGETAFEAYASILVLFLFPVSLSRGPGSVPS